MKKIILSAAILLSSLAGIAQMKEGKITYDVEVIGLPPEYATMMDGAEQIVTFKNEKKRIDFNSAAFNFISINDGKKNTLLNEQMGASKTYTEISADTIKKREAESPEPVIEYKDETKKIAGYDCKKALVKVKTKSFDELTFVVWYTEEIPVTGQTALMGMSTFKNLKGAPLEYEGKVGPFDGKYTANNVSKAKIDNSVFIPKTEGYVKKSMEEMRKMGGGK